jgi:hypothetical protein
MLELYVFLFVIPGKVRKIAKPRGESTLKWTFLSWLSWLAIELLAVLLVVLFLLTTRALFSWPDQGLATILLIIAYFIGLAGGMTAADKVRGRLEQRPTRM